MIGYTTEQFIIHFFFIKILNIIYNSELINFSI